MQPKVNAVHECLSLCISERRQRRSSLKVGNLAAPKKSNISHGIRLNSKRPLNAEHMAHVRRPCWCAAIILWPCGRSGTSCLAGKQSTPSSCSCDGNFKRVFNHVALWQLATRWCGRWERHDCLLFLGSKFCLVSFEITGGTCWGAFLYHGNLESLP